MGVRHRPIAQANINPDNTNVAAVIIASNIARKKKRIQKPINRKIG
jgi:hypothetical protein